MQAVWINYALMAQFASLSVAWWFSGDRMQCVYWFGAFACTAGVTFK
jgi:hypothetical protein